MINNPSFYVLYPKDECLRKYINSIKLLSDYNQRTEAHITVRGPYKKKLSNDFINKNSEIIAGESLFISNVENFFAFNQNTVYFKCDYNENLKRVWNKITYNDFKPHITLYDGDDRDYAVKLFNIISKNFNPFYYEVGELTYLEPKNSDGIGLFKLKNVFDFEFLSDLLKNKIDENIIKKLDRSTRLSYIDQICSKLYNEFYCNNTSIK